MLPSMRLLCIVALRVGAASSDTAAADIIVRRVLDGTPTFDDDQVAVVVPAGRDCTSALNEAMFAANGAGGGTVATRDDAAYELDGPLNLLSHVRLRVGRGTTLRPQDWTALALDCSFATSLADAVANYTAGDTITMSMIAGVSASAMGVGFNRQMGRPIQFSLARADVLAALNEASAKGDGTAYGPPRLPPGVASCGGFTAAERLAQQASAQVLGVVTSLRFAWGEAGLPNDR